MIWKRHMTLEALNATSTGTLVENLGIVYTRLGDDLLEATMPVDTRTHQPFGLLHGGARGACRNARLDGRLSDHPRRAVRGGHRNQRVSSSRGVAGAGARRLPAVAYGAPKSVLGDRDL